MLKIAIYDDEFFGCMEDLIHVCDIEGSAIPHDRPAFDTCEETLRVLQLCGERYTVPQLRGPCFTVFIGSVSDVGVMPLIRLDGYAHNGSASASVESLNYPRWDTERVTYTHDDDAVEVVRKILSGRRTA